MKEKISVVDLFDSVYNHGELADLVVRCKAGFEFHQEKEALQFRHDWVMRGFQVIDYGEGTDCYVWLVINKEFHVVQHHSKYPGCYGT